MKMITVKVLEPGYPPPTGNPFRLYPVRILGSGADWVRIGTGLSIKIPTDVILRVQSLIPLITVMGVDNVGEELAVIVGMASQDFIAAKMDARRNEKLPFALADLFEAERSKVRFVEMGPEGGRMVRGDAAAIQTMQPGEKHE